MSADLFEAFGGTPETELASTAPVQTTAAPKRQDTGLIYARQAEPQQFQKPDEPLWKADEGGNDVLFDAADEDSHGVADDDFGDFEDVQQSDSAPPQAINKTEPASGPPRGQQESTLIDLLSLEDTSQPHQPATSHPAFGNEWLTTHTGVQNATPQESSATTLPQIPDEDDAWGDFEDVSSATPKQTPKKPASTVKYTAKSPAPTKQKTMPPPEDPPDDDWDVFEDGEPIPTPHSQPTSTNTNPPNDLLNGTPSHPSPAHSDQPTAAPTSFPPSATRPTNIPPPSTLLSLLTTIYPTLPTSPSVSTILHLYHATASITAARTHRWRRDTLLSQSTRISAATTSKSGMKLSSLNKSESAREEREAQEALDAWNARAGRWWAVVREEERVQGKKSGGLRLQLPLGIRVVGAKEGGMEAGYVCPVCGMKRSERVVGVDDGVEDVFGEFWVEGWGHRSCGEVWYGWKGLLGQR